MRHLALLAIVYVLMAALVLPSSLFAADEPQPAVQAAAPTTTAPSTTTAPAPVPAPAPAPAPAAPAPTAPAPAPATPAQPAAPAPEPAPVQKLDDADAPAKGAPRAQAAASASVTIKDFDFTPPTVTVNVGDTVSWTNQGPTAHSATASGGAFDTGIFAAGQTRSATFDTAGTFAYICTPHPFMKGTVIVQAASTGGGGGGTGGAGTSGTDSSGTAGTDAATGPQLASTGMDVAALAVLGALMCLLGVAVRRRSADEAPRPAVPNGW
jgi:plastocyanin